MAFGDILSGFAEAGHEHRKTLLQLDYQKKKALAEQYGKLAESPDYPEESRREFLNRALQIHSLAPEKKLPKEWENFQITVQPKAPAPVNLPAEPGVKDATAGLMKPGQEELPPVPIGERTLEMPTPAPVQKNILEPMSFQEKLNRERQMQQMKFETATAPLERLKQGEWKKGATYTTADPETGELRQMQRYTRITYSPNPDTGELEPNIEEHEEEANKASRGMAQRFVSANATTFESAIKAVGAGEVFNDPAGRPYTVERLKAIQQAYGPNATLHLTDANAHKYVPVNEQTVKQSIGGRDYIYNKFDPMGTAVDIGQTTSTLPKERIQPFMLPTETGGRGVYNAPVTTETQTPGINRPGVVPPPMPPTQMGPAGNPIVPMSGAPGALPPQMPPTQTGPAGQPLVTPPTGAQAAPTMPPPTAPQATPPAAGRVGTLQPIPGTMNPAEYGRQQKIYTQIKPSLNMMMGDPENPGFRGLEQFAYLADDPRSRARLNNAARLVIHELADTGEGGGGLGASLFGTGVSIGGGGLMKALENKFGVTEWKASTSGKVIDEVMSKLTPNERMFLDRIVGAYGTVVGLRAVTGGSALQFNAKLMEKELPVPGLSGMVTKRQFYDKVATLIGEPISSTKTFSPRIFVDRPYYITVLKRMTALGNGEAVRSAPGKPDIVFRNGQWVPLQ